jgi:hypothetical protein
MTDAIAKLNEMLGKIFAYGPPKKNAEKQAKRVKKSKIRKKRAAAR